MNKFTLLCLTSVLGLGVSACGDVARTSTSAPNSVNEVGYPPDLDTVLGNESDATNQIEPLAREIRGVRDVNVQAEVGPNLPPYKG